jgi:hypothetical protein
MVTKGRIVVYSRHGKKIWPRKQRKKVVERRGWLTIRVDKEKGDNKESKEIKLLEGEVG